MRTEFNLIYIPVLTCMYEMACNSFRCVSTGPACKLHGKLEGNLGYAGGTHVAALLTLRFHIARALSPPLFAFSLSAMLVLFFIPPEIVCFCVIARFKSLTYTLRTAPYVGGTARVWRACKGNGGQGDLEKHNASVVSNYARWLQIL